MKVKYSQKDSTVLADQGHLAPPADRLGAFVDDYAVDDLIGMLLTYVDATYTDSVQREAQKSLIRQIVRRWHTDQRRFIGAIAKWVESDEATPSFRIESYKYDSYLF